MSSPTVKRLIIHSYPIGFLTACLYHLLNAYTYKAMVPCTNFPLFMSQQNRNCDYYSPILHLAQHSLNLGPVRQIYRGVTMVLPGWEPRQRPDHHKRPYCGQKVPETAPREKWPGTRDPLPHQISTFCFVCREEELVIQNKHFWTILKVGCGHATAFRPVRSLPSEWAQPAFSTKGCDLLVLLSATDDYFREKPAAWFPLLHLRVPWYTANPNKYTRKGPCSLVTCL